MSAPNDNNENHSCCAELLQLCVCLMCVDIKLLTVSPSSFFILKHLSENKIKVDLLLTTFSGCPVCRIKNGNSQGWGGGVEDPADDWLGAALSADPFGDLNTGTVNQK